MKRAIHIRCTLHFLYITHNALVNRTNYGWGPLHLACEYNNKSLVTLLLQSGAVVNQEQVDGVTPLYSVCYNGFNDLTELLLEHGANIDQCTDKGHTPLYAACKKGHTKVVRTLFYKKTFQ
jgi:ankyrin repeat protein